MTGSGVTSFRPQDGQSGARRRGLPSALLAAITLTACAPMPTPEVSVRHTPSTVFYDGTRFHLFTFDPSEARSLNDRIRLARNEINADPDCRWRNVPTSVIEEATKRQGDLWEDRLLAAPVECRET